MRVVLSMFLLLMGCTPVTINEVPEREGDDPGECSDDADNDADGAFDCDDPDCAAADACACPDADEDGICDADDVCPDDPLNDSDGDTVCDSEDVCLPGDDRVDSDDDGTPDDCDPCPVDPLDDSDGDGVCDSEDECPGGDDTIDLDDNGVPDDCDAGPGVLLISDGSGTIHEVDEEGTVLAVWFRPAAAGLRGVTYDRAARDGFWVVETSALGVLTKIDWDGSVVRTLTMRDLPGSPTDPRGLDYHLDVAGDRLVMVGREINDIDSMWNFDVVTGSRLLGSTHFRDDMFHQGFWGIHQIGVGVGGDWARWTSWPDGTLQRWDGSQSYVSSIETGLVAPKGISIAPGGDFWVVDAAADRVLHLSSTGALLSEFPTPGSDPLGISYWE